MHALPMIFKHTAIQFVSLFGAFFVVGLCLSYLARLNNIVFNQFRFPSFGLYFFGAIGTAVHELSHAFFCRVFLHEIKSVKLFDAKAKGGAQGSVVHTYEPWNPYHRLGHYFIGLGPALLGPFVIAVLFYALIPEMRGFAFTRLSTLDQTAHQAGAAALWFFQKTNLASWRFWTFVYFATCIATQIELSKEDLKQARFGCLPLFALLLLANIAAWAAGFQFDTRFMNLIGYVLSALASIFVLSAILSTVSLVFWTLVLSLLNRALGRDLINPFKNV
jgi:hypothetical protein